jgi:predicted DNA-binding transcriptional regulator AlpA
MEYTFTLKYQLLDGQCDLDDMMERLGASGCEDALVGMGQSGRIALEFTREAPSAQAAFVSALADVRRAIPDARLIEAVPDFVGLTDAAEVIGVTRQNMRKLMIAHAKQFPAPVHCGTTAIWHLADILTWLQTRGTYELQAGLFEVAAAAMQVNLARAVRQAVPGVQQEVSELVA